MKVIALDVDGVLLDLMPSFDAAAEKVLNRKIEVQKDNLDLNHYHLEHRVNIKEDEKEKILNYMITSGIYSKLAPLEGAKEALEAIKEAGFKIVLVTALPEEAREMRLHNLKIVFDFVPDEIYCVGMGMSKSEVLAQLNPDVFIDDRIDYLASAPHIYHLAWVDQKESQKDMYSMVDVRVKSLKQWTEQHMPRVVKKLNRLYEEKIPVQIDLKLENPIRKYGKKF